MKKIIMSFLLATVLVGNAGASKIGKDLGREDVSHLELITNNLNMLFLLKNNPVEAKKNSDEIEEILVRFSVVQDRYIMIESYFKAPVSKVTREECTIIVKEIEDKVKGKDSALIKMLPMLSVVNLTQKQAESILVTAQIKVILEANENNQLRLSCSN